MTVHDPLPIGLAGSLRFRAYVPFGGPQAAPWFAVGRAGEVDLDPSRARGPRPNPLPADPKPSPGAAGPAVLAAVAYPNVKGLTLGPTLAFEVHRLAQGDEPPQGDRAQATRAYGASVAHLTGFLGLLEPLDLRV